MLAPGMAREAQQPLDRMGLRCSGCQSSQLGQPRMRRRCLNWLFEPLWVFLLSEWVVVYVC